MRSRRPVPPLETHLRSSGAGRGRKAGPSTGSTSAHAFPEFLPDGRHFVYTVIAGKTEEIGIYVGALDGASLRLSPDASNALYAGLGGQGRSGALLFRRGDTDGER